MTCKLCDHVFDVENFDDPITINAGTDKEYYLCEMCKDGEMDANRVTICEACGEYIEHSMIVRDESLEEFGDFDECPCCHNDCVEGYSKIKLRSGKY